MNHHDGWDIIHRYTRDDAIADGVLADVTDMAKEAGFGVPVALTAAVWEDCVYWADADNQQWYQDQEGRLWDVLFMAAFTHAETFTCRCAAAVLNT